MMGTIITTCKPVHRCLFMQSRAFFVHYFHEILCRLNSCYFGQFVCVIMSTVVIISIHCVEGKSYHIGKSQFCVCVFVIENGVVVGM